jgi:oligoendopeptidase F
MNKEKTLNFAVHKSTLISRIVLLLMTFKIYNPENAPAQKQRSGIAEKDTWNLSDLYPSDEQWRQKKDELIGQFDRVAGFQGKLTKSAEDLYEFLGFQSSLSREGARLFTYAGLISDQDTRISAYRAMRQELVQAYSTWSALAAFAEPEIVAMDWSRVEQFMAEKPELEVYRMYLGNLHRRKMHTLSAGEEKIMADAGLMAGNPASVYNTFTDAEMPFPDVTLSDGVTVHVDKAAWSRYRALENREDREKVFHAFWKAYADFNGTLGETLYGQVKRDVFYARARKYGSSLESALDPNNIPVKVYHSLIENVNNNLGTFHRYLRIKKRMLGVDTLKYSDIYAPTVEGVNLHYTYGEAREILLDALQPLGTEYLDIVQKALDERWIDVYPSQGKTSGAYSSGNAYAVHPYILLNYNGLYEDVSTLAHEMGHTMHSYFSNASQPFPLADYSIFVAEVASTFNEALLMHEMLNRIRDDRIRLSLLMSYLDGFKGSIVRQTQFAEFELKIHELVEKGTPLTGDLLREIYGEILKKYYGHDEGVCYIDDDATMEWAFIPHFYTSFYVYQYSTSYAASLALAESVLNGEKGIRNGEQGARERYIKFLSAGGSGYPIDVLKAAGVDLTTSLPFEKTMQAVNRIMDEIEGILDGR